MALAQDGSADLAPEFLTDLLHERAVNATNCNAAHREHPASQHKGLWHVFALDDGQRNRVSRFRRMPGKICLSESESLCISKALDIPMRPSKWLA